LIAILIFALTLFFISTLTFQEEPTNWYFSNIMETQPNATSPIIDIPPLKIINTDPSSLTFTEINLDANASRLIKDWINSFVHNKLIKCHTNLIKRKESIHNQMKMFNNNELPKDLNHKFKPVNHFPAHIDEIVIKQHLDKEVKIFNDALFEIFKSRLDAFITFINIDINDFQLLLDEATIFQEACKSMSWLSRMSLGIHYFKQQLNLVIMQYNDNLAKSIQLKSNITNNRMNINENQESKQHSTVQHQIDILQAQIDQLNLHVNKKHQSKRKKHQSKIDYNMKSVSNSRTFVLDEPSRNRPLRDNSKQQYKAPYHDTLAPRPRYSSPQRRGRSQSRQVHRIKESRCSPSRSYSSDTRYSRSPSNRKYTSRSRSPTKPQRSRSRSRSHSSSNSKHSSSRSPRKHNTEARSIKDDNNSRRAKNVYGDGRDSINRRSSHQSHTERSNSMTLFKFDSSIPTVIRVPFQESNSAQSNHTVNRGQEIIEYRNRADQSTDSSYKRSRI
jgi:hypothetical protein